MLNIKSKGKRGRKKNEESFSTLLAVCMLVVFLPAWFFTTTCSRNTESTNLEDLGGFEQRVWRPKRRRVQLCHRLRRCPPFLIHGYLVQTSSFGPWYPIPIVTSPQNWDQTEQNVIIDGLVAGGINGISMFLQTQLLVMKRLANWLEWESTLLP